MKTVKLIVLSLAVVSAFVLSKNYFAKNEILTKKEKFRKFMAEHPFKKHRTEFSGKKEKKGKNKTDRPDLAWEQNFLTTLDPALGYPPTDRLVTAQRIAIQRAALRNGIAGLDWDERGPNNVGGRTRAIMFDPNDGTNKKVWAGGVTGGLWYNNDITSSSSTWTKVDDFWNSIAISCIASDPNNSQIFYVGTGESFTASGSYPSSSSRGAGIWKTINGGTTWTQLDTTKGYYYVSDITVRNESGTSVVYACVNSRFYQGQWHGSADGLFRSTNGGTSWTEVLPTISGNNYAPADIEIAADNRLWVGSNSNTFGDGGGTILYSDNGTTWTVITDYQGVSGVGRVELACAPSNSNVLYALIEANNETYAVASSTNKGSSWTDMTLPDDADLGIPSWDFSRGQAWYDLIAAVDPTNENKVVVGAIDLFYSTDGGSNWSQISKWSDNANLNTLNCSFVHADQHAIVFRPGSSSNIVSGNDGGIFYCSNLSTAASSDQFSSRNANYNITQFYSCAMNPTSGSNNFLAGAQDNGTQLFSTSGINSTTEVTGGDGGFCFIDQENSSFQIASYTNNIFYRSSDGGNTFPTTLSNDGNSGRFINAVAYDSRENILYSGYDTSSILRIKSVTGSFTSSTITISGLGGEVSHISSSPYSTSGTSTIFIGTENGDLFKLTNAHATPTVTNISGASFPSGNISCIEIGASENELLVTFANYGVTSIWYSSTGGSAWASREGNLPDMPVRWALFNPNDRTQVILATEVGIWSTTNISVASPDWDPSNTGMGNVRVDMLKYRSSDKMVIAATHGRGLFSSVGLTAALPPTADFSGTPTAICAGNSVAFSDNSTGSPTSWTWTFTGGTPASSTSQNPSVTYNTGGTFNVKLKVTNANGSDSITKTGYITVTGGQALPLTQDFQLTTFPPTSWTLTNPDADTTWRRTTAAGGFGASTASALKNNFDGNDAGKLDHLLTPVLDFSGTSSTTLTFDVAYARYNSSFSDTLIVYYSTNCGTTWTQVYKKGGTTLSTRSDLTTAFTPTSAQWRTETIDLSALDGMVAVQIRFTCKSGYGNNIYFDNVNIDGSLAVPTADFSASTTNGCLGSAITFTNASTGTITTYSWNFGSGASPATASTVGPHNVTYSTTGAKTITLTVTGPGGSDTETKTNYVTISSLPTANAGTDKTICNGGSTGIGSSPVGGITYSWSPTTGLSSSTIANPTASPTSTTTYIVTATNTSSCIDKDTVIVTVNSLPTANAGTDKSICIGGSTGIGSSPVGGITYSWSPTTGLSSSTIANPTASPTSTTTYIVTATNASSCTDKDTVVVTVNSLPTANAGLDQNICNGESISIGSSPVGGITYSWNPTTGLSSSTIANPTASPASTTTYIVTATNAGSCTDKDTVIITVDPKPVATISSSSDVNCFGGNDGSATCSVTGGSGGNNFTWSSGQSSATVNNFSTGNYSVIVTDMNSCKDTATVTIAQPTSPISLSTDSTDDNGTGNGTATVNASGGTPNYIYSWSNGQTTAIATNLAAGTYNVTVTDNNGCTDSASVTVNLNTGLAQSISVNAVNLSPNPFASRINVQMDFANSENVSITVQNVEGKIILSEKLTDVRKQIHTLNFENNADGIYFVKIKTDKDIFVKKIILAK